MKDGRVAHPQDTMAVLHQLALTAILSNFEAEVFTGQNLDVLPDTKTIASKN